MKVELELKIDITELSAFTLNERIVRIGISQSNAHWKMAIKLAMID